MFGKITSALILLLEIVKWAIFARVIVSWLPVSRNNQLIALLYQMTEPILAPLRNIIQRSALGRNMMFDFAPLLAFLIIGMIQSFIR